MTVKNILISGLFGITALFVLHLISDYTGIRIAINGLSMLIGGCLGIPGVALMLLFGVIL